jgi:hypothetical protein
MANNFKEKVRRNSCTNIMFGGMSSLNKNTQHIKLDKIDYENILHPHKDSFGKVATSIKTMFKMKSFIGKIRKKLTVKHEIELQKEELKTQEEQKKIEKIRLR